MDVVHLPQRGGCLCGAVRFSLNAPPLLVYACHCHDCQTRTGTAFGLAMVVRSADVEVTGPCETYHQTQPSGREIEHTFCPTCRVRVLAKALAAMDFMTLRPGALDDAGWVRPIGQLYVESAIPWAVIPGVRHVTTEEFDFVALGEEWQASAPRFVAAGETA